MNIFPIAKLMAYFPMDSDIFSAINTVGGNLYVKLLSIDTIIAVVAIGICLIIRSFTSSSKTAAELTAWMKRVGGSWAAFNVLGAIITYVAPLLKPYQYSPGFVTLCAHSIAGLLR